MKVTLLWAPTEVTQKAIRALAPLHPSSYSSWSLFPLLEQEVLQEGKLGSGPFDLFKLQGQRVHHINSFTEHLFLGLRSI